MAFKRSFWGKDQYKAALNYWSTALPYRPGASIKGEGTEIPGKPGTLCFSTAPLEAIQPLPQSEIHSLGLGCYFSLQPNGHSLFGIGNTGFSLTVLHPALHNVGNFDLWLMRQL